MKEDTKMGRPTKLTQEIIDEAWQYLNECKDGIEQFVKQSNSEKGYDMYENRMVVNLPTKGGLAVRLKVSRDTLYEWAKENEHFSDIMETLGAIQEERLINGGLSGRYNPIISKVLLAKHGYRDAKELSGVDGKDLIPPQVTGMKIVYEDPGATTQN